MDLACRAGWSMAHWWDDSPPRQDCQLALVQAQAQPLELEPAWRVLAQRSSYQWRRLPGKLYRGDR